MTLKALTDELAAVETRLKEATLAADEQAVIALTGRRAVLPVLCARALAEEAQQTAERAQAQADAWAGRHQDAEEFRRQAQEALDEAARPHRDALAAAVAAQAHAGAVATEYRRIAALVAGTARSADRLPEMCVEDPARWKDAQRRAREQLAGAQDDLARADGLAAADVNRAARTEP